jgi:hypothetical protein
LVTVIVELFETYAASVFQSAFVSTEGRVISALAAMTLVSRDIIQSAVIELRAVLAQVK